MDILNLGDTRLNLKNFYKINNKYQEIKEEVDKFYNFLREANSKIDLSEIKSNCDYKETKDIYQRIQFCINDKSVLNELKEIMNEKKEKEYPQILGVHYFPDLLKIELLSDERKIKIDKILRDAYDKFYKRRELHYLGEDVLNSLIDVGILEKEYLLGCKCGSSECSYTILSDSELSGYKNYWEKELEDESNLTKEDDDKFNYGCIEIGCWNDIEEITSLEEFNNYENKKIQYKFIKKPNLELENI